jgi:hypothetical protein
MGYGINGKSPLEEFDENDRFFTRYGGPFMGHIPQVFMSHFT